MTDPIQEALSRGAPPIVAILRGVRPEEAEATGAALVEAGVAMIEVPLNSPDPLESIAILARRFDRQALIGAGTVTQAEQVAAVAAAGGLLVFAPNTDPGVIRAALSAGCVPMPGVMTPTEAFTAIAAGARHLKLFPAATLGQAHLRALREVLPPDVSTWAVGGTDADGLTMWLSAGARGIGVGSALYRPGATPREVGDRARALVAAWVQARAPNRALTAGSTSTSDAAPSARR